MRASEPGWTLAAMNDPSGRRGIWYRMSDGALEICAGREGDDCYVALRAGETMTTEKIGELMDCLQVGACMVDESGAGQ